MPASSSTLLVNPTGTDRLKLSNSVLFSFRPKRSVRVSSKVASRCRSEPPHAVGIEMEVVRLVQPARIVLDPVARRSFRRVEGMAVGDGMSAGLLQQVEQERVQ